MHAPFIPHWRTRLSSFLQGRAAWVVSAQIAPAMRVLAHVDGPANDELEPWGGAA